MRRHAGPRQGVLEGRDAALIEPPHPLGDRAHTHGKSFRRRHVQASNKTRRTSSRQDDCVLFALRWSFIRGLLWSERSCRNTIRFRTLLMNNVFSKDS